MSVLDYSDWQEIFQTKLNKFCSEAEEKIVSVIEYVNPCIIASIYLLLIAVLYVCFYYSLPWSLWKHMVLDGILCLTIPLILIVFSGVFKNVWDFAIYENKKSKYDFQNRTNDIQLQVWEERKYYKYVGSMHLKTISVGYNVIEDSTDENVEAVDPLPEAVDPLPEAADPLPEADDFLRRSKRNRALSTGRKQS